MTAKKPKHLHKDKGRPPKITKDVLQKLEDAFMFCYTDEEACLYAGIAPRTLYYYQEKHPNFMQRKEALRLTPNLKAKAELVKGIDGSVDQARWWAKNKMASEFSERSTVKHEGKVDIEDITVTEGTAEAIKTFNETMRSILTKKKK